MTDVGDKILWTAVIASAVVAYFYIPSYLYHVRELAVVPESLEEKPNPQLSQDAEDAIKLSTIEELANGYNFNLAASAIRLAVSRFVKSGARDGLLADLSSKAWYRRDRAISLFTLLLKNYALSETDIAQHFMNKETFSAIITALTNLLPQHATSRSKTSTEGGSEKIPPSPIKPYERPAHERSLISILNRLLNEFRKDTTSGYVAANVQLAVEAGVITRWLAHYPFPCTLPENSNLNFNKSHVCSLIHWKAWGHDDILMAQLFTNLMTQPIALKQLSEAGLRTASATEHQRSESEDGLPRVSGQRRTRSRWPNYPNLPVIDDDDDVHMVNGEETAGHIVWRPFELQDSESPSTAVLRPGSTGRSPEEEMLRRRHREAIVVAEAGTPLRPENILQRVPTETDINWERTIADQQEAILRHRASTLNLPSTSRSNLSSDQQAALERIDGLSTDTTLVRRPSLSAVAGAEWATNIRNEENNHDTSDTTLPQNEEQAVTSSSTTARRIISTSDHEYMHGLTSSEVQDCLDHFDNLAQNDARLSEDLRHELRVFVELSKEIRWLVSESETDGTSVLLVERTWYRDWCRVAGELDEEMNRRSRSWIRESRDGL